MAMKRLQIKKLQFVALGFLCLVGIGPSYKAPATSTQVNFQPLVKMDDAKFADWLLLWKSNILDNVSHDYCTKEMGEDMGWLMLPMLKGFYYGYLATGNLIWPDLLLTCTDSWMKRGITEPDGFVGWPKVGAAG